MQGGNQHIEQGGNQHTEQGGNQHTEQGGNQHKEDVKVNSLYFTSTEARWIIRDGDGDGVGVGWVGGGSTFE